MSKITSITGRAVPVVGDDIDTDRIIPARYLKEITFSRMGEYPFYDERFNPDGSPKDHPFNKPEYRAAALLIANSNFGCGSSREHAPQALGRWGIKAVVAESFGEIFAGNCAMLGIPTVTASSDDVAYLQKLTGENPSAELTLDLNEMTVKVHGPNAKGREIKVAMPNGRRKALIEGIWDSTSLLIANGAKTRETVAKLPYVAFARK